MKLGKPSDIYKITSKIRQIFNYFIIMMVCSHLPPGRLKNWLLRRTGMDVGKYAWITPHAVLDPLHPENIHIESGAFLGWGARLFTHIILPDGEGYEHDDKEITIKSGGFVGGYSTVHPGVTVEGTLYNNSVASKDIPEGEEWGGIPAERKD